MEREFEPIFEREVVNYEIPVIRSGETVYLKINLDNTAVVLHDHEDYDVECFDHLLIYNEETQEVVRLWRQKENGALFERLSEEMGFDTLYRQLPTPQDQEAYLGFVANRLNVNDFFDN